jgi:hypothetical protein
LLTPPDAPFATLAAVRCPAFDEMLLAVEHEFREVDRARTADALDELARPLFGLAAAPLEERAVGLARAAWEVLPGEGDAPSDWLLARALERRTATGAVRAALAVELGRRTGIPSQPLRLHGCWAIRTCDPAARMAADVGSQSSLEPTCTGLGAQCAHQVAFVVLTALATVWRAAGASAAARRASGLRLLLPLDEALRRQVRQEL